MNKGNVNITIEGTAKIKTIVMITIQVVTAKQNVQRKDVNLDIGVCVNIKNTATII